MKKFVLVFFCFSVLILGGCATNKNTPTIKINNHIFKVELAQTSAEHFQGLSDRKSLGKNSGMFFVFPDYKIRTFVMRKMNFPLDIIWIKDNFVVACEKNVQIFDKNKNISQVVSSEPINYVLEVNAGVCEKYKIKSNDTVYLPTW